jgi:hypothetical protein
MLKEGAPVCRIPGGTYLRVEVKADTGTDVVLDNTGDALPNTRNIGPILTTLVAVVEAVLKDFLVLWEQPPPAPQPPPPIKWHERAIWWLRRRICD